MKLGVIAGIHEDFTRLEMAIKILGREGCDAIACLGDMVGYSVPFFGFLESRNAHEVVRLVREHCQYTVVGNHDLHAARKLPSHTVFRYPDNWYELDWISRRELAKVKVWLYDDELPALLTDDDLDYLRSLPEYLVIAGGGNNVLLGHYAYPDLVGDSSTSDPNTPGGLDAHFDFMRMHNCSIGIAGHDFYNGAVVHTSANSRREAGFGTERLGSERVWIEAPWVANSTVANGVLVLELSTSELKVVALDTPPHVVPGWVKR